MALNKQIHIYSVDTSCFYNKKEIKHHDRLNKLYLYRANLKKRLKKFKKDYVNIKFKNRIHILIAKTNKEINTEKNKLKEQFSKSTEIRVLNSDSLTNKRIVSIFDSTLTRCMQIPENTISKDLIIVQTYFFDVIEDIILDGFLLNNEKYICFTASAGQIRTKKTVFIKESILLKHQKTLMCGLTIDDINNLGGVNINKYLAYLALCNSATDLWNNFDIDKCIVVEDFETMVKGLVDFIDDSTYDIYRQEMYVPITHTDGCGMMLLNVSKKSFMTRLPWVKGLLVPFDFKLFIEEHKDSKKIIVDIYGKEWDVVKDDIQIIFTKSQFKMYKYYSSWQQYKDYFKKYNCQAGICNIEEDTFTDAKINYQMLQTLVNMTDEKLEIVAKRTNNDIYRIGNDRKTMLKVLGVTKANINKNYYQQALEIYPQLLCDTYSKEILKQTKKSMVKHARAGKLDINGKYTFLIPDLYAFCEYLFLGDTNPKGLLENNEVYCGLYKEKKILSCLRSPHLYREWAVRNNVVDDEKEKWFITNGVYTSCHDLISKVLQFDNDGDKSLVCADDTLNSVAEEHMKDIVPLFYNMKKAKAEIVNNKSIFNGLKLAYTGGNIGLYSNDITKIWNSIDIKENKEKALEAIKLLCMENNFTIDYAKTLYKPVRPIEKKKLITAYTKNKTPHFFVYAKDKEKNKVEPINDSLVNRLEKIVKDKRIIFNTKDIGESNYRMLMNNKEIVKDEKIIKKYTELDLKNHFMINCNCEEDVANEFYLYQEIKNKLLIINPCERYVTDVLVEYLYGYKKSSYKTTLWECFGDVIIQNLKNNIKIGNIYCKKCGTLVEKISKNKKYCDKCAKEIERSNWIERKKKQRNKSKCHEV